MIEIHLYGLLRRMVRGSSADQNTILTIDFIGRETFGELLQRFGLDVSEIGDCFINGRLAFPDDVIKDGDRIGLFPFNMRLIDGGLELKYSPHKRQ